jgi:hypothetical protein
MMQNGLDPSTDIESTPRKSGLSLAEHRLAALPREHSSKYSESTA